MSASLLVTTLIAYSALSLALTLLLPDPPGRVVAQLFVDTALALLWIAVVLRIARKPERFLQTATAVFGFQLVVAPVFMAGQALLGTYGEDPTWHVPVLLLTLVLGGWALAVNSRILASATGWPVFICLALVLLQALVTWSVLVGLFPEILAAPPAAPAAPAAA